MTDASERNQRIAEMRVPPPYSGEGVRAIDKGIAHEVKVLWDNGIDTTESCQGGQGHPCPEPIVRFAGDVAEGFKALAIAFHNGLDVRYLRRVWRIEDGQPIGPEWEMTFHRVPRGVCVGCGAEFSADDPNAATEHLLACEKHPLNTLRKAEREAHAETAIHLLDQDAHIKALRKIIDQIHEWTDPGGEPERMEPEDANRLMDEIAALTDIEATIPRDTFVDQLAKSRKARNRKEE
jgi:hypothetical protein